MNRISFTKATNPRNPIPQPVHRLGPVMSWCKGRMVRVPPFWNEYIGDDIIGFSGLIRRFLALSWRYFVMLDLQIIALLGAGAAAWQAARHATTIIQIALSEKRHLPLVVNNARFLILPWVQGNNLASKILSLAAKQVPEELHKTV